MLAEFNWVEAVLGSPISLILVFCSILTLGVAIERTWYFWRRKGDSDKTLTHAMAKLRAGRAREAVWVCEMTSHPFGPVARQVLENASKQGEIPEETLQIALSQQRLLFGRNVSTLGTMAAIAPLIGLLGTVWGIMRAFRDMSLSGSAAPSVVAAGIAEALVTTAIGLIVAVPAVVLYNHFTRRTNVMLTEAENGTRTLRSVWVQGFEAGIKFDWGEAQMSDSSEGESPAVIRRAA
jgi:biopolymer transport protein ExbB